MGCAEAGDRKQGRARAATTAAYLEAKLTSVRAAALGEPAVRVAPLPVRIGPMVRGATEAMLAEPPEPLTAS